MRSIQRVKNSASSGDRTGSFPTLTSTGLAEPSGGREERRAVGRSVRSGPGGQTEGGAQQDVPERRGDGTIGVPHHFDVIDLAERHVHRQVGKVDYIEVMGYSDHLITLEIR